VLPFLVLLSVRQDIDMRAALVTLLGVLSWSILVTVSRHAAVPKLQPLSAGLLCVYMGFCILSLLVHHSGANLFGSPLVRLGTLVLVSNIGCGLLLNVVPPRKLLLWLYLTSIGIVLVSIPYTVITLHHLSRLSGVFQQADVLAAWIAVGFIFGVHMWHLYPNRRLLISVGQVLLAVALVLTQTRAVIFLLAAVLLLIVVRQNAPAKTKLAGIAAITASLGILIVAGHYMLPTMLSDPKNVTSSISYRLDLQTAAMKSTLRQPIWGNGAGSVGAALKCPTLKASALQHTCREGYYFDSSHNVFLDRILEFGYVGGLAYAAFAAVSVYKGLSRTISRAGARAETETETEQIFSYAALLLCLYYFTNVTNVEIELLLTILLLRTYRAAHA
jgi:O-antigen ligase